MRPGRRYPPQYARAQRLKERGYRDLPEWARPQEYEAEFPEDPDLGTERGLHAAGQSGIVPVGVFFNLIERKSILHELRPIIGVFATLRFWRGALELSAAKYEHSDRPTRAQVFIPKSPNSKGASWLLQEIGITNTQALCRYLGGAEVSLPNGVEVHREEARRIVAYMQASGANVNEIKDALSPTYPVSEDWIVRQIRSLGG